MAINAVFDSWKPTGRVVPAAGADPAAPGYGGERLHDGVRQSGRVSGTALRSPVTRRQGGPARTGTIFQRAGRGRRRRDPKHSVVGRSEGSGPVVAQATDQGDAPAGDALPGLCDIEFTIERGKLWMLQTRVGKRTAAAAFRIAAQLVDENLITMDEGCPGCPVRSWRC